jgi:DNA helicase-2/ATP-dependent DNA helicase PcrA
VTPTPSIILGPPGTGKTTTLLSLVEASLARGVPPDKIGYFSFTRKAAQEAIDRACEKFDLSKGDFPFFSTIHSLCFKQLGMKRGDVLEGEKLQQFAKYAGVRISGRWSDDGTLLGFDQGDRILFMENLSRISGVPLRQAYDAFDDDLPWSEVERVSKALVKFKRAHDLMDFTDMLSEFARSGIRIGLTELFIDESQDLSPLQWSVVAKLAEGCKSFTVAGDDDQAIYRWAGADVDHLIDMQGDVRVLGQSWRVPPAIQAVANGVISSVKHRREKLWNARTGDEGTVGYLSKFGEANVDDPWREGHPGSPVLVLARNAYVLREQVEPELRKRGIVYERNGHSSINLKMLRVIQFWEKLRRGEKIEVDDARKVYALMTSGRGYERGNKTLPDFNDDTLVSIEDLRASGGLLRNDPWHDALDRIPRTEVGYMRAARQRGERLLKRPRLVLSTIHAAKGGEADHVVLMKEIAQRSYREIAKNPDDERRVWYVGVTRAREKLTIVESQTARRCPWI